jgi:hypothetical protein
MNKSLLIAMSVAMLVPPVKAGAAEWMSSTDIMRELVGTELSFRGKRSGTIIYSESGEMRMQGRSGMPVFGKWRIDENSNSICARIFQRKIGKEVCYRTRHDGFGYRTDQGYKLMPLEF